MADFVIIDCTGGAASAGGGPNITADVNAALAAAQIDNKKIVFRGGQGARKWVKLDPTVIIFDGAQIAIDGRVGIQSTSIAGSPLIHAQGALGIEGDLQLDGGNASQTIAGGYVKDHTGLHIRHPSAGAGTLGPYISRVRIEGLSFTNWGYAGIETFFCRQISVMRVLAERIGCFGQVHWSPLAITLRNNWSYNIFPGEPPAPGFDPFYRNAYGLAVAKWTGDPQPDDVLIEGNTIADVTSWEGIDVHTGSRIRIIGNKVSGCSSGIALENHISAERSKSIIVSNNEIEGYVGPYVRDGVSFYNQFGIGVTSSLPGLGAERVVVSGNSLNICGEGRPSVTGGGAINIRHARNVAITGNVLQSSRQCGIALQGYAASTDEILDSVVAGNAVVGIASHASSLLGIAAAPYVQGLARGNVVTGAGSAAAAYGRMGTAVYDFNFGGIGSYGAGAGADNVWN